MSEIIIVKCANQACRRDIPFVKGTYAIPDKTYCDYCCGEISAPPNDTPLDRRTRPTASRPDQRRGA
jgi:hypothetical protein